MGLEQEFGLNQKALVMKEWDQFHQGGKELANMVQTLVFDAIGTLSLFPSSLSHFSFFFHLSALLCHHRIVCSFKKSPSSGTL